MGQFFESADSTVWPQTGHTYMSTAGKSWPCVTRAKAFSKKRCVDLFHLVGVVEGLHGLNFPLFPCRNQHLRVHLLELVSLPRKGLLQVTGCIFDRAHGLKMVVCMDGFRCSSSLEKASHMVETLLVSFFWRKQGTFGSPAIRQQRPSAKNPLSYSSCPSSPTSHA